MNVMTSIHIPLRSPQVRREKFQVTSGDAFYLKDNDTQEYERVVVTSEVDGCWEFRREMPDGTCGMSASHLFQAAKVDSKSRYYGAR